MAEPTTATASHPPGPQTTQSAAATRNGEAPSHPPTTADNTTRNAGINDSPKSATEANAKPDSDGKVDIGPNDEVTPEQAAAAGLPEQKHAGAVGYGPEYANMTRATMGDKIQGLKEEIKGKLKKDPELVKHGKELRTGELKRRQHEEADQETFKPAEQEKKKAPTQSHSESQPPVQKSESVSHDSNAPRADGPPQHDSNAPRVDGGLNSSSHHDSNASRVDGGLNNSTTPGAQTNTPTPYPPTNGGGHGLNGGKSDNVDLNPGAARLTKGHGVEGSDMHYKRDGQVVDGDHERGDPHVVRAGEI